MTGIIKTEYGNCIYGKHFSSPRREVELGHRLSFSLEDPNLRMIGDVRENPSALEEGMKKLIDSGTINGCPRDVIMARVTQDRRSMDTPENYFVSPLIIYKLLKDVDKVGIVFEAPDGKFYYYEANEGKVLEKWGVDLFSEGTNDFG